MDKPVIEDIRDFRLISPNLGTSGMPREEHLPVIRAAGFEVVGLTSPRSRPLAPAPVANHPVVLN